MTLPSVRRVLLLSALLAVILLALVDFLRQDSFLRRTWADLTPDRSTPAEQGIKGFLRGRGRPVRP